ncbi:MAG TPA: DUF3971 domain-containing protein [Pseudolabrys sp.]|nr:DUF3971 domain-containing protein [Pseudolabrys sp.]
MTASEHDHGQRARHAIAVGHGRHHRHVAHGQSRRRWTWNWRYLERWALDVLRMRLVRRLLLGGAIVFVLATIVVLGLWWRLSIGPIELDIATPWLKAAIEENFGGNHSVVVGGTQIERDEKGRTSLRLRDIVVRDRDGTVVASAPKAEVGLSGRNLLFGRLIAQSLNLVGAEMSVRIETDGRLTVFAGADKRPIAVATPVTVPPASDASPSADPQAAVRAEFEKLAGIMAWIDALGQSGLDGHDLRELGLKNGNLVVDDRRNGKRWTFDGINASLTRPRRGGVVFKLESDNPKRPWVISAAMRPLADGVRAVGIEARKVSTRDILLALRMNTDDFDIDLPVSASIRADILADGTPRSVQGQLIAEPGTIVDRENDQVRVDVDRADFRFGWDGHRHMLVVPFQIQSGGNQFTMRATLDAPPDKDGVWTLDLVRGDAVIDPIILAPGTASDDEGIAINRVAIHARIDTTRRLIDLEQGDLSRIDTRPSHNIGLAVTGRFDYSGSEPHVAFGVAGTRMPVAALKRLWPIFAAVDVRTWVEEHISGGTVERVVVAGNAPLEDFKHNGPPTPEDGLSVDIETSGTTLRPLPTLPPIRDADLTARVTGSYAVVNVGRGTVEVAPGRKLNLAGGVFEVPDTHPKPAPARASFRIDGTVPAAVALLSSEGLRDTMGISLDPASTRGTVSAQVNVKLALARPMPEDSSSYSINADLTNFAADRMLLGQRVEATSLKAIATADGYQIKGDARINGTMASIDLRKQKGDADPELHLQATIDEAARRRLGFDLGSAVTGAIPVKVVGRIGRNGVDDGLSVEADLTPVKIDNLLPGWVKPAGRPERATYTMMKTGKTTRLDDMSIDGSGATVRGSVEFDSANEIVSANFPVFALSDGDKMSLKADRSSEGVLRVTMRGDVYDGRNFVKSSLAGSAPDKSKQKQTDLDLDVKVGTVAGHNGETLRGLDLKMSRRSGHIRSFVMTSKIGRDTPLNGDLRVRARDNHQVIYFETDDAGALFRFTDMYPRMYGGQMWVAMDPPTQEQSPQIGTLYIRRFAVRGEPTLEKVVAGAPGAAGTSGVDFSEMRADFTRSPGKTSIRDGVVRGPLVGATIEGNIDYVRDNVHLRGTFVPFYGINNMFGQIPIVGLFLGGGNKEGLLGITYEAVGPPGAPRITVNPVSAIAPGLLRKFIPSPGTFDPNFAPPPSR